MPQRYSAPLMREILTSVQNIEWLSSQDSDFRRCCGSALTHPVTVASLGVLLLNDLVFKSLWPGSWATGKLSDLAWMVFAPPLLAYLLSFLLGGHRETRRAAFLISYVGLPLLYATYNSFGPVHDVILQGLSLASGAMAASPLDPSDSLVIPFAVGIAVWVWRQDVPSGDSLRLRCGLLMAGVAALASVATSYPEPDRGIASLWILEDGSIQGGGYYGEFMSVDGGLTWTDPTGSSKQLVQSELEVQTPRGRFEIHGPDVVRVDDAGR